MAALEKLHSRLALADTAFTDEQNAFAIDLHQDAVARDPGSQRRPEIGDNTGNQGAGGLGGAKHRNVVLFGHGDTFRPGLDVPGDDQRRKFVGEQAVKNHGALLLGQFFQIAGFHIAQNLQAHGFKMVEIARQLQPRTRHVRDGQADGGIICGGKSHLQVEFLSNGCQRDAVGIDHQCHLFHMSFRILYLGGGGISTHFEKNAKNIKKCLHFFGKSGIISKRL